MKIGMIGFGNMAQAIYRGLEGKSVVKPDDVYVCAAHYDTLRQRAERYGVHACESAQDVIDHSELVVLPGRRRVRRTRFQRTDRRFRRGGKAIRDTLRNRQKRRPALHDS